MARSQSQGQDKAELKIAGSQTTQENQVQKLTVRLPARTARLLKAYCAFHGTSAKQVVTAAIQTQLAGFYCASQPARGTRNQDVHTSHTAEESATG